MDFDDNSLIAGAPAGHVSAAMRQVYVLAVFAVSSFLMAFGMSRIVFEYEAKDALWTDSVLDSRSQIFNENSVKFNAGNACIPIHVGQNGGMDSFYLHCSAEALAEDQIAEVISADFVIPKGLERRVHFWQRIYSLWSIHNYVLHAGKYPEVIFEIEDASGLVVGNTDPANDQNIKRVVLDVRNRYRQILLSMHFNGNSAAMMANPTMARIAGLMKHIDDKDKYLVAAQSLRVQRGQREFIKSGIEYSRAYLPHIEPEFRSRGLPPDLAKIAFVESSFNIRAYSRVGAAGVYQIMPDTGAQYMRVSDDIDERLDPVKAGVAAARLFALYYRLTEDWPLAVTSYNHGVGSIMRAVQKSGTKSIATLIDSYDGPGFGFASKNFYCEFLGILGTLSRQNELFQDLVVDEPLVFMPLRLTKPTSIADLAKAHGVRSEHIRAANLDLRKSAQILPKGYVVKIPSPSGGGLVAQENEHL